METKTHIAESSHWYDALTGEPRYYIIGKNGKERPTTLRDAREFNYVPSVTTILQTISKPFLDTWKQEQVLYASLTMPRPEGITDEQWISLIIEDSKAYSKQAMDLGTIIHAQVQGAFEGIEPDPQYKPHVDAVRNALHKEYGEQNWIAEKSFAHPLRYGGKVDLFSNVAVIDFKTTSLNGKKLEQAGYDEHLLQLCAYAIGLGIPNLSLCNVYISTSVPGEVYLKVWDKEKTVWGAKCWLNLLSFWKTYKRF